ncbi:ABC-ATPase domain-containing protein [Vibrio chagasii]|nr:ABC-ATPase domain-containing protein [Vibrio chagasii]
MSRSILARRKRTTSSPSTCEIYRRATLERELNIDAMIKHCETIEDQEALRTQLDEHNLSAFVANGSVLPRIAGNLANLQ